VQFMQPSNSPCLWGLFAHEFCSLSALFLHLLHRTSRPTFFACGVLPCSYLPSIPMTQMFFSQSNTGTVDEKLDKIQNLHRVLLPKPPKFRR
jgi:hypothetical protein